MLWVSTSGHDKRLLQNANGGRSNGDGWWTGDIRCARNDPFLGGAKHSNARDCLLIDPWFCGVVPGAGTTFGKPIQMNTVKLYWHGSKAIFNISEQHFCNTFFSFLL